MKSGQRSSLDGGPLLHWQRAREADVFLPGVYGLLSKYTHPSSIAHFSNFQLGEGRTFTFQSAPRFKRDEEKLVAYAWCIELSYFTHVFLFEYAEARGCSRSSVPE